MSKWTKKTYKLDAMYGWECKPGYTIFVADRGAVRFDFPEDWIFDPGDESGSILKFHDREPPDDDCVLQVSIFRIPPGMPWNDAPLSSILSDVIKDPEPDETRGPLIPAGQADIDLLWRESCRQEDGRPACSRQCLARGNGIMVLMTLDFWTDDAPRVVPVWDEILRTLRLGEYVRKPGPRR
ncbi:MAG: hypothetical protein HW416_2914 [Chloroflexi bacterium]|nr:hypothetical protein [Chloroflexota bacterium]